MVESIWPDSEKALTDRLKHEAEASQPEFSESLHTRICQAVWQDENAPQPRPATRSRRRLVYACIAAASLVVAVAVTWQLVGPRSPNTDPASASPIAQTPELLGELYALSSPADQGGVLGDPAPPSQDWADLDHDARIVTQLLINQLPLDMLASNDER